MSAVAETPADIDLGALAADATRRLGDLEEARLRLSPESLTDATVAGELSRVESEIESCKQMLERVRLARTEVERRELQAQADAAEAARQAHLAEARRLQAERRKQAAVVDKAASVYAKALREFDRITSAQEAELRRAGDRTAADIARPRPWMFELALAAALRDAGCPHGILRVEALAGAEHVSQSAIRPLGLSDSRPIEPAESK
jgi:chromosome segregation ATPase